MIFMKLKNRHINRIVSFYERKQNRERQMAITLWRFKAIQPRLQKEADL
jgi:hypothetical protein